MSDAQQIAQRLAREELDRWEWAEECTCEDDPVGTCWYHLSGHHQREYRVERLARLITSSHQALTTLRGSTITNPKEATDA